MISLSDEMEQGPELIAARDLRFARHHLFLVLLAADGTVHQLFPVAGL